MSEKAPTKPAEKPAPEMAKPKPAPEPESTRARRAKEELRRRLQPTPVWPD